MTEKMVMEKVTEQTEQLLANAAKTLDGDKVNASIRMMQKKSEMLLQEAKLNDDVDPVMAKAIELMGDEAFKEKFLQCEDAEAIGKLFGENGAPLEKEDVDDLVKAVGFAVVKVVENGGELSEEELENVAGGGFVSWFKGKSRAAKGALIGLATGIVVGAVYGGLCVLCTACPPVGAAVAAVAITAIVTGGAASGVGAGVGAIMDAID